jgi:hypothetical protein
MMPSNPVDLARVLLLPRFDAGVMMGYTDTVFERFFGSGVGTEVSASAMLAWLAAPLALGMRPVRAEGFSEGGGFPVDFAARAGETNDMSHPEISRRLGM